VIRVLIVASSPLARAGLENLLATENMEVAGSVANMELLVEQLSDAGADVVLLDVPAHQSESALESIVRMNIVLDVALVVIAEQARPQWTIEALRAGVRAVLPGDVSQQQLVAALRAAADGLLIVHPADAGSVFPPVAPASRPVPELAVTLTPREREVLQMLAGGLANKEIASRLAISEHTVKFHVTSILGKLGATSRTEAVSIGIRHGLILL
jgi:two-component system, NarL family, response regulator YdfI